RLLHAGILAFMPEPAGTDRNVAFGGQPFRSMPMSGGGFLFANISGRRGSSVGAYGVIGGPTRIARNPTRIPHPSHVGTDIAEKHSVGLRRAPKIPGGRPVVVVSLVDGAFLARAAIEAVTAVGSVVPDFEDGSVIGQ